MFDALDEVSDALEAQPEGFYTRFAVTFSSEEAAEHGDAPDDLADGGRCFRDGLLGEDVSAFPLFVSEEQRGVEIRPDAFVPSEPTVPTATRRPYRRPTPVQSCRRCRVARLRLDSRF